MTRDVKSLRSQRWFVPDTMRGFAHRQRLQQTGLRREEFMGKPVIAILNAWSELSPCHVHLRDRAEAVKRGVWQAGGYPVEIPVLSVGEVIVKPTTMLYRNLLAMEVEEVLRSHPVDGAVLLGGCDKSTPAMLMGAISMDLPSIFCPAGPMSSGQWRGVKTGAGTHTRKYWDDLQAGRITPQDWVDLETGMTRSIGTCNTMGTASTMTSIADAMGMTLPGASSIPAADSGHPRMASECGSRAVAMVLEDLKPSGVLTRASFMNGAVAYMALGGSTNAAIHMLAMARRAGIALTLDDLAEVARKVPVCADLFPTGGHLMEEFFFAGGLRAMLWKLKAFLSLDEMTVNGRTIGENITDAPCWDNGIICSPDDPVVPLAEAPTLAVLRGNLAPDGAVMKVGAADSKLLRHTGRAVVFDSPAQMYREIDDPALEIDETSVLVLRNAGPVGAPGMPEWGNLPVPKRLLAKGVTDLVRICDGRMSGTHYGTCILHVSPEAAIGGPLALLRTGDSVRLDVPARRIDMLVSDEQIAARRAAWMPEKPAFAGAYADFYRGHVLQADQGCDFDFLDGPRKPAEPEIY